MAGVIQRWADATTLPRFGCCCLCDDLRSNARAHGRGVDARFANSVDSAAQVISVVGTGGAGGKLNVNQRIDVGWQVVAAAISAADDSVGMSRAIFKAASDPLPDFAFCARSNPGEGLPQIGPDE